MIVKKRFFLDDRNICSIIDNNTNQFLHNYNINEYFPDNEYSEFTFLAAKTFNCSVAFIGFITDDSLLVKSVVGLDKQFLKNKVAFQYLDIVHDAPVIVNDTLYDKNLIKNSLFFKNSCIRFYAAVPLITNDGNKIGSLCIMDNKVNHLSDSQILYLQYLANRVVQKLELRRFNIIKNNPGYKKYILTEEKVSKEIISKHKNSQLIKLFFKMNKSNEKFKAIKIKDLMYAIKYYFKNTLSKYDIKFNISLDLDKNTLFHCKPSYTMKNLIHLLNVSIETVKAEKFRWINLNIKNLVYDLEFSITDSCKIKNHYSSSSNNTHAILL